MAMYPHVDYPHKGNGDLYDCPACEQIMADKCEAFCAEGEGRCPACGEFIDYCPGHGRSGDPDGYDALRAHDRGDHSTCAYTEA